MATCKRARLAHDTLDVSARASARDIYDTHDTYTYTCSTHAVETESDETLQCTCMAQYTCGNMPSVYATDPKASGPEVLVVVIVVSAVIVVAAIVVVAAFELGLDRRKRIHIHQVAAAPLEV